MRKTVIITEVSDMTWMRNWERGCNYFGTSA